MGGGGGKTEKAESEPWQDAQPYLKDIMQGARGAYKATPRNPYLGDMALGAPSDAMQAALGGSTANAQDWAGQYGGARQLTQDMIAGKYLDPNTNPFIAQVVQASLDPMVSNFNQKVMPGMNSQAIAQGAYGGNANALAKTQAGKDLAKQMADTSSGIYYQNYNQERTNQNNAMQFLPQLAMAEAAPHMQLVQNALQGEGYQQNALNNEYQRYMAQQNAPWIGLDKYSGIMGGMGGQGGTTQATSGGGGMGGALTGAMGGGMAGAGMAVALGATNPWLAAAIGGGMLLGGGAGSGMFG